ncbi:MAG: peptidylprolyl isomerase [Planctomycetota bacterium]
MKTSIFMLAALAATSCCLAVISNGCLAQTIDRSVQPASYQEGMTSPALADPSKATLTAPAEFKVKVATTKGDFIIKVTRANAPNGADRFYNMVKAGFFKDVAIFRAIKGFMFQFGIHGDPQVAQAWGDATIKDDPPAGVSNTPGTISFAQTSRPNSRSSQMFINLGNNDFLDRQRIPFVPFGQVVEGMEVVNAINTEYGENSPEVQGQFRMKGNAYIQGKYPNLDYIRSITVIQ